MTTRDESLRRLIEEISSVLELRPLLTSIVGRAAELLGADDGAIGLYDEAAGRFRMEALYRLPESELGRTFGPGEGLAGRVLESGRPVVLERYGDLPGITLPERAENTVMGLPIHWRGALVGFFGLGARPPRRFSDADVDLLALFARHAAIAIENARRHAREQEIAVLHERQRLARELHDSITQLLASATMIAESVAPAFRRDPEEGERRLARLVELNRRALAEMRSLLRELRPDVPPPRMPYATDELPAPALRDLAERGLVEALRRHLDVVAAHGVTVALEVERYRPQAAAVEEVLLSIANEAVHNAIKHAGAASIRVQIESGPTAVQLAVVDDGRGLPEHRRAGGHGLAIMAERAAAAGGIFDVGVAPGGGTRVIAILPVAAAHEVEA